MLTYSSAFSPNEQLSAPNPGISSSTLFFFIGSETIFFAKKGKSKHVYLYFRKMKKFYWIYNYYILLFTVEWLFLRNFINILNVYVLKRNFAIFFFCFVSQFIHFNLVFRYQPTIRVEEKETLIQPFINFIKKLRSDNLQAKMLQRRPPKKLLKSINN